MSTTRIADVIVPEIFTGYAMLRTAQKSRLLRSGAMVADPRLSAFLAGAGLTIHSPSFRDLADEDEDISTDDPTVLSSPSKIGTLQEIAVRLSRNKSWSSMDLTQALIEVDPMDAIAELVAGYWTRRQQAAFVAIMKGIFANNDTATDAYHVQGDMKHDISGASFVDGVTNFGSAATIDTTVTMGDSMDDLTMVMMHSIVYARAQKNNMIDFVEDSDSKIKIPLYLGREVIVDDGMPNSGGVFESWLCGRGCVRFGAGSPKVPTEVDRNANAGNGSGEEILHNRVEWALHPEGHAYIGTAPVGGPSNLATANNLAAAASWRRVFPERKQTRVARLITREY